MGLNALFSTILGMSVSASIVISVVLVVRLLLRRAPQIFSYILWIAVLFRLLCPISIATELSVFRLMDFPPVTTTALSNDISALFSDEETQMPQALNNQESDVIHPDSDTPPAAHWDHFFIFGILWISGAVLMFIHGTIQFIRLKHKLKQAVRTENGVYLADHVNAPFVIGWVRPKIYLPSSIQANERHYIIRHEKHHIRRCDHIFRLMAYLALCVHWFNPLVWLAFILSGSDMEISCDEAVIRQLDPSTQADYAASLLKLSARSSFLRYAPLSFGEVNTKRRILHIAQYRKPGKWVTVACTLLCVLILTACISDPKIDPSPPTSPPESAVEPESAPEDTETSRLRGITGAYLGSWYLAGTNDVTLELTEEHNTVANTYKLFFHFSKLAPKNSFIIPYETLEEQMKAIGIELKDGQIIVTSGGVPYTFIREVGSESVTAQFPHLSVMGRWYFQDNPNGYIDFYTECRSNNYDRSLMIKYAYFDPYDLEFCNGSFWFEPGGLLYSGSVFGDENGKPGQNIWFQIANRSISIRLYVTHEMTISGTTFTRTKS